MNKYVLNILKEWFEVYESIAVVGERGQITIPKTIREVEGINAKDKVIVKIENKKIVVEKKLSKKEKEELMKEYYQKYSKLDEEIEEEWKYASKEADEMLDDY
jgi:AbrB family looped-hinge helix DNA binding protein